MFYTPEIFQEKIVQLKEESEAETFLETITTFCEENSIDVLDVIPLLTPFLKSKLLIEGMNAGHLKREPTVASLFPEGV